MRVLLVALNAKFVHTNLALRYLREGVRTVYQDVLLREFSINDHLDRIAAEIYEAKADVVGFSCYIWNLKEVIAVIRQLRPVCPKVRFVIGGPEVSFEAEEFLREHSEVDALVIGEGEESFLELLQTWQDGRDPAHVPGLAWTKGGKIMINPAPVKALSLNDLSFPYAEDEDFTGRIVYVETTRGCPFNCQYCLSSTFQGVRFLEPERFRKIFCQLLKNGARTIKFVDRTFNANKRHALKILDIVKEESIIHPDVKRIRVHCEMAGDLFDAEWMDYLKSYPQGLIQLEIGVQSTYQPTLKVVSRPQNFEEWKKFVPEMQSFGIPLHLDLIAGLPEESWADFRTSFNDVYGVNPDMLQLGFLKVLKGSGLRLQSNRYGLLFNPDPPYTILETNVMSHCGLLQLHRMEDVLDKYYNSGKFTNAVREVLKLFPTPFDFYHGFAEFWQEKGWFHRQWQGKALFDKLWEFLEKVHTPETKEGTDTVSWNRIRDALRFDYYMWERPNIIPDFLQNEVSLKGEEKAGQWKAKQEMIRKQAYWETVIPGVKGMDRRQWHRNTAVAYFTTDILQADGSDRPCWYLFHYQQGNVKAYRYEGS
ncbi:B12-binding domain-containing radical SAM protein [Desulfosporosinus youngiae]|uniref:Fe-S oxidoreductase n=1 Tax=Desulfosporosinus youngiae DSM 17734 TaxID=768710 RepID=H5Y0G5_9FIRM|nr:B12-binding domain-containing radical SAM protein [Desulfosporosinus youngiae]EHQ92221.1 Fe-S oxidoreductase [Desulfosporosinus youngiae DSM 17734]